MSLDLSGKTGVAYTEATTPLTNNLAGLLSGDFVNGSPVDAASKYIVFVSAASGNITITPSTTFTTSLQAGDVMVVVKVDASVNKLSFTDPETGLTLGHVNQVGESHTLVYSGTQWIYEF